MSLLIFVLILHAHETWCPGKDQSEVVVQIPGARKSGLPLLLGVWKGHLNLRQFSHLLGLYFPLALLCVFESAPPLVFPDTEGIQCELHGGLQSSWCSYLQNYLGQQQDHRPQLTPVRPVNSPRWNYRLLLFTSDRNGRLNEQCPKQREWLLEAARLIFMAPHSLPGFTITLTELKEGRDSAS